MDVRDLYFVLRLYLLFSRESRAAAACCAVTACRQRYRDSWMTARVTVKALRPVDEWLEPDKPLACVCAVSCEVHAIFFPFCTSCFSDGGGGRYPSVSADAPTAFRRRYGVLRVVIYYPVFVYQRHLYVDL